MRVLCKYCSAFLSCDSFATLCCILSALITAGDISVGVGAIVGTNEGALVGAKEGAPVGESVGAVVGSSVGAIVGLKEGENDGAEVGLYVGSLVGLVPVHIGVQEPLLIPTAEFQYGMNDVNVVLILGL